jgi:hypothetical protein
MLSRAQLETNPTLPARPCASAGGVTAIYAGTAERGLRFCNAAFNSRTE